MRTAVATLALAGSAFFVACGGGSSSKTPTPTSANTTAGTAPSPAATKAAPTSASSPTPGVPTVTPAPVTTPPPPPPPPPAATEPPAPPPTTAPPPPPAPTEAPPPPPPPPAGGGTLTIAAVNVLFDTKSLSATAGPITIVFNNQDNAVAHNIQFFSGSTSIGMTEIATGPDTQTLSLGTLAPGSYSYKCDVHPTTMSGTLTVS